MFAVRFFSSTDFSSVLDEVDMEAMSPASWYRSLDQISVTPRIASSFLVPPDPRSHTSTVNIDREGVSVHRVHCDALRDLDPDPFEFA